MSERIGILPDWHAACAQVAIDFAVAIDHGDYARVLSLFAADAVFDRFGEISRGHNELRAWLHGRPEQMIRHVCSNFSGSRIASGEVEGVTYFTAYRSMGRPQLPVKNTVPLMIGEWIDTFVLLQDGWRIKKRSISPSFVAAD